MSTHIDKEYHCHTTNPDDNYREVEKESFDGKCTAFIEGHSYDDSKGYVTIWPWQPYSELEVAQREYEKQQLTECKEALKTLGVEVK